MTPLDLLLFWLAIGTLAVNLFVGLRVILGSRQIVRLVDVEPMADDALPSVSIIVAARNEERNIEAGLQSLVNLDYPVLEIVAVNDRSTDATGEIIDRLASGTEQLQVVHVRDLPKGWLGKNHALHIGAERATGEWLLFTDADVVMQPSVLRRAVRYATENNIDHLPILPRITMPNWFLEAFVVTFALYFSAYFQPWKAKNPHSRCYVGIGAFNLIRSEVYRAIGTHQAIAMRPDDDVKLGKIVKKNGHSQEILHDSELMYVPWYGSLGEVIVGLEKNAFSGVDYQVWLTVLSSAAALTLHVWPFVAVLVPNGAAQWINGVTVLFLLAFCLDVARHSRFRWWCVIAFPVTVVIFVYIQWRAMFLTFWNNGIRWRDTHYSLAELKANKV